MKRIFYLLHLIVAITSNLIYAQDQCATDLINKAFIKSNPSIQLLIDELEKETQYYNNSWAASKTSMVTFSIPIVVHVVHDYGAENINDAQIISAINQLNLDFSGANPDLVNVIPQFTSVIGTPSLVFVPARLDPSGNCTNGIDRIVDEKTYTGYSKPNQWPPSKYVNFWIVNNVLGGPGGFASPPTQPSGDQGLVIQYNVFNTSSRTPTHEMGHFLNLQHTFEGGCQPTAGCLFNGDNVCDTPPTTANSGCPSPSAAVNCGTILANYQNFMDYSNCRIMFTQGQLNRMFAALNSTIGARSSLISPTTAIATGINLNMVTCPPKMEFSPGYLKSICVGDSIRFEDMTYSNTSTTRIWNFHGGTPSTSTNQIVWVKYNSPGTYSCNLVAQNSAGTNTLSRMNIVHVISTSATYTNSFSESFESVTTFTSNWKVLSKSNNAWQYNSQSAYTGSSCIAIQNKTSFNFETDLLYSPTYNLSTINNPKLAFARANARINNSNDKFSVLASNDCGKTWNVIYFKQGASLATTASIVANFIPSSVAEWHTDTIDLGPISSQTNVRFAFQLENDGGNNLYLDDINVFSGSLTSVNKHYLDIEISVYPNPTEGALFIESSLISDGTKAVICNSYGQIVREVDIKNGLSICDISTLNQGIYLVKFESSGRYIMSKKVVKR
jgi:PKD repeat protein